MLEARNISYSYDDDSQALKNVSLKINDGEMAAILNNLSEGDILFVDEIHRLNRQVEEVLYPAMEDYKIDIMIGKGATARSIRLDLPQFTLILSLIHI